MNELSKHKLRFTTTGYYYDVHRECGCNLAGKGTFRIEVEDSDFVLEHPWEIRAGEDRYSTSCSDESSPFTGYGSELCIGMDSNTLPAIGMLRKLLAHLEPEATALYLIDGADEEEGFYILDGYQVISKVKEEDNFMYNMSELLKTLGFDVEVINEVEEGESCPTTDRYYAALNKVKERADFLTENFNWFAFTRHYSDIKYLLLKDDIDGALEFVKSRVPRTGRQPWEPHKLQPNSIMVTVIGVKYDKYGQFAADGCVRVEATSADGELHTFINEFGIEGARHRERKRFYSNHKGRLVTPIDYAIVKRTVATLSEIIPIDVKEVSLSDKGRLVGEDGATMNSTVANYLRLSGFPSVENRNEVKHYLEISWFSYYDMDDILAEKRI